jgi:ATP-dependent RNA helicase DHX8/PRP22
MHLYTGKGLAYGQLTTKPLREQRESLPIYRLKNELCQAIATNQVLVVIGETGSGNIWLNPYPNP